MPLTNLKLIAFDLDGTIIDSVPDLAIAADKAAKELGFPGVEEEQARDYVGNGADVLIARVLSQSLHIDPSLSEEVRKKARVLFDDYYEETQHQRSRLYAGVKETIQQLFEAGYTLAVITNKPSRFVPEILKQHDIIQYFTDIIGGDRFETRKPDPIALNWVLSKHQLTAEQMLMVGDSKNDILAAQNAGCESFGLTYGYNHGEPISLSKPTYTADNFADLLKVVLK
ncbi:phosphoglycolate phosphatase [Vibrio viridaestus]|uniref:Phosphoglycolate phosphatase n=1 Tax=Vibrio viridaestus TaxID=2487322 RepID=A0A3N9TCS2_9VIBR|nr:phosphoglycolate phosphatase [Vibrio viridaestus]RQW61644.1 phosphoglycolate phosphatase [Vibrio viridaestus]